MNNQDLALGVRKRGHAGSCSACRQPEEEDEVIQICLGNVLVRVCQNCAIDLRNRLTSTILGFKEKAKSYDE